MSIDNTLNERGARYGDFTDHARICQTLKNVMMNQAGWGRLEHVHKQALDVIADKIARILSGDPNYADNWHDIQGYAKLVEDRLDLFTNMDKQPQKTTDEVRGTAPNPYPKQQLGGEANVGATLEAMTKRQTEDIGVERAIKALDDEIQAKLAARREIENREQCDCPACKLQRFIEAEFAGSDVEVKMFRVDPDEPGPVKH